MKPVERDELLDLAAYERFRDAIRALVLAAKRPRRVHLGPHWTLLFENRTTVRYQVQEMLRAERIVREAEIRRELDAYNELLGGEGGLGATMLIEIEEPAERARKLVEWFGLPEHLHLRLEDGTRVPATFDERQRGDGKLSSVQFFRFAVGGRVPVAAGVDLPGHEAEVALTDAERAALADDLAGREPEWPGAELLVPSLERELEGLLADELVLQARSRSRRWSGADDAERERLAAHEETIARLADRIAERLAAAGGRPAEVARDAERRTRLEIGRALRADHEGIASRARSRLARDPSAPADLLGEIAERHEDMARELADAAGD